MSLTTFSDSPASAFATFAAMSLATFAPVAASAASAAAPNILNDAKNFVTWMMTFNKTYSTSSERHRRWHAWKSRTKKVDAHNESTTKTWTAGLNANSDLTPAEMRRRNGFLPPAPPDATEVFVSPTIVPKSVDWRLHGLVNDIKNQQQCGSCWAFSAIASLEGQFAKHHNLTSFSEQDLVDCVKNVDSRVGLCCDGCEGGLMSAAFDYIVSSQNGGDDLENKYSYDAIDENCRWATSGPSLGRVIGQRNLPQGSHAALEQAVATVGPISVGVDANDDWQMYQSGVYVPDPETGCSSDPSMLDHGVAVVGYNTDTFNNSTMSYWIIRNSWGTDWGIDGYMYLSKDVHNACGLANFASYPVLSEVSENQCLNSHPQCPSEVCYTPCPCACFVASSTSPCDCSAATCSC